MLPFNQIAGLYRLGLFLHDVALFDDVLTG